MNHVVFLLLFATARGLVCDVDSLSPLTTVTGWVVNVSKPQITAGDAAEINVFASSGTFLDIVLFAANGPTKLGTWQPKAGFQVVCGNLVVNANDQSPKTSPQKFSWISPSSYTGPVVVTVALRFSAGWTIFRPSLLVIATNAPPACTVLNAPAQTAQVLQEFNFNVNQYCYGPTGTTLTYGLTGLSQSTGLTVSNGKLAGKPSIEDLQLPQPLQVRVTVSSPSGSAVLNIPLTVAGTVPVLNCRTFDTCVTAGAYEPYVCDFPTFCPTSPPVTFTVVLTNPLGLSLKNGTKLTGVPQALGNINAVVSYSSISARGSQTLNIRVIERLIPAQTAQLGVRFQVDLKQYFLVGFSTSPKPFWSTRQQIPGTGLLISRTTGVLAGFPTKADRLASPMTFDIQMTFDTQRGAKSITVLVVGDVSPPRVRQPILQQQFPPGQFSSLDLSQYWESPSGYRLNYSMAGLPVSTALVLDSSSGILSGTPSAADIRVLNLSLSSIVIDSIGNRVMSNFTLLVQEINSGPSVVGDINSDPSITSNVFLGVPFSLDLKPYFVHPQNFALTYTVTGLPAGTGLSVAAGVLRGTPTKADRKTRLTLQATASDSRGKTASVPFSFPVLTRPPITLPIPASVLILQQGTSAVLDFTPYFSSRDGGSVVYRGLTGLPFGTGLTFSSATRRLTGIPSQADRDNSPLEVVLSVAELDAEPSSGLNMTLSLTIADDPDPPPILIQPIAPIFLQQYQRFEQNLGLSFRHPDVNKKLSYRVISGLPARSGININSTGYLVGLPNNFDYVASPLSISFQATGSVNKITTSSVQVNIVRNLPTVTGSLPTGRARLNEMYNFSVAYVFTRPFDLTLQFKFAPDAQPPAGSGFTINTLTGIVQGIPKLIDFTSSPLSLQVEAGNPYDDEIVKAPFILFVSAALNITAEPLPAANATVGLPFSYDFSPYFSHPGNLPLTYSVAGLPALSSFSIQGTSLRGTAKDSEKTTTPLRLLVTATDPNGTKSLPQPFELTIRPSSLTHSPTTLQPTSVRPTSARPTSPTSAPTTAAPITRSPVTSSPTTDSPTKRSAVTVSPTTKSPATLSPTTTRPTTTTPTTHEPTTRQPTSPTRSPTTSKPTNLPTTNKPSRLPTSSPTPGSTSGPTTLQLQPTTSPSNRPRNNYGNGNTVLSRAPTPSSFVECLYDCVKAYFAECTRNEEESWSRDCNLLIVGPCRETCGASSLLPTQVYLDLKDRLSGSGARLREQEERALQLQDLMFQTVPYPRGADSTDTPLPIPAIVEGPYVPRLVTSRPSSALPPSVTVAQIDSELALLRQLQNLQQERLRLIQRIQQN